MDPLRLTRRGRIASLGLLTAAVVLGAALAGGQQPSSAADSQPAAATVRAPRAPAAVAADEPRTTVESALPTADEREPSRPATPQDDGFLTAQILPGATVALYARPDGQRIGTLPSLTEFGSPRVLSVVDRRGDWLGVHVPELPNGTLGWIDGERAPLRFERTTWSVRIDLSERRLEVRDGGKLVREADVAVGTAATPTPTGRFAVTDTLDGSPWAGVYGCCIVALSATQPNLAAGWQGGNRIAIHGTSSTETIGEPVSNGCLRAHEEDIRYLYERLPLGTPVTIVA